MDAGGRAEGAAEHEILACYPSIIMSIFRSPFAPPFFLLVLLLFSTIAAEAATTVEFLVRSDGHYAAEHRGRLLVDGHRWRIDYDDAPSGQARTHDTLIVNEDKRRIAVNHSNRTWFYLESNLPTVSVPTLFDFYRANPTTASKLRVEFDDTKTQSRTSGATRVISFRFRTASRLGTESVRGEVSGQITLTTGETLESNAAITPLSIPTTGIADVDRRLTEKIAEIDGTIVSSEITITRSFSGGSPMTQIIRESIEDRTGLVTEAEPRPFEVPDGYRYQMPQIGGPGRQPQ